MQTSPLARHLWGRVERLALAAARASWRVVCWWDTGFPDERPWPSWAPGPLRRSTETSGPPLGWPRRTDSLCPRCVQEGRGIREPAELADSAAIPADIVERDGAVWMIKVCPEHGRFEEIVSEDARFLERIEGLFAGRDYAAQASELRHHGASTLRYGRGSVLNIDLTNRCNLRCTNCFADAEHGTHVHELEWEDIQRLLLQSLEPLPRRQMSIQFSGGEPTLSPHFLEAVRFARKIGYFCVQCASNGIRFAQDFEFCRAAKEAGLRICYLQFDGTSNQAFQHRNVSNLFDVKAQAVQNLKRAGIDVVLVPTVASGVNDQHVGDIVRFAIDHVEAVTVVSFQPISFSGRDEHASEEQRRARRYTLTRLVKDLEKQLGFTQPLRDWFPLSAMNPLSDAADLLLGAQAPFGAVKCGCHPHCGVGTILLVNKRTKQAVPITEFVDIEGLLRDFRVIADAGRGRRRTLLRMVWATLHNFHPERAPAGFGSFELARQLLSQIGAKGRKIGDTEGDAKQFEWRFLFVAGMWFQDLYNYDFRRTEMCIIPYATPAGEIPFCAYNTGAGWREQVEKTYRATPRAEWNQTHERHPVYAGGKAIPLSLEREAAKRAHHLPVLVDRAAKREPGCEPAKRASSSAQCVSTEAE